MLWSFVRTHFRTLRFWLTLWYTAGVLVLLVLGLITIQEGFRRTLCKIVDQFLDEEMVEVSYDVSQLAPKWSPLQAQLNARAAGHPRRRLFVELFDAEGKLFWSSIHTPMIELPSVAGIPADRPIGLGKYHLVQRPIDTLDGRRLIVRVGCSVELVQIRIGRFTKFMLAVGAGFLLLAPLGGYLLAGRATRPLAKIIAVTAQLRPEHLRERLPIRATHDELDQLSQTINGFLDRIAYYLSQIRDFTAHASHELRSPLTALYSTLEIALSSDRSAGEYKEVLAEILSECGWLRTLLNQLLLLAEGDAGRLCTRRDPVQLDRIVARSLDMFQAVAEQAGVALKVSAIEPVTAQGDEICLWQVVNNLIDNAIKYTPAGGSVSVDLRADDGQGGCLLRVQDTGMGITAEDLPHVFDRFYRASKARQRNGRMQGTGLGLSICQAVIAAHGGTIRLASTPAVGTEAIVWLPASLRSDEATCMSVRVAPTQNPSDALPHTSIACANEPEA
jgi:heavy metal sensor kinase